MVGRVDNGGWTRRVTDGGRIRPTVVASTTTYSVQAPLSDVSAPVCVAIRIDRRLEADEQNTTERTIR